MENICGLVNKILTDDPLQITSELVQYHLINCPICSRHGETFQDDSLWNPRTLSSWVQPEVVEVRKKKN